jgi:squalene-hopene/tetraprenyl-beta-curcumene cyclase
MTASDSSSLEQISGALAGRLKAPHKRLTALVGGLVEADGAVRGRCASRAMESALLLRLLRKQMTHLTAQKELVNYLHATPPASRLDRIVIDGALGQGDDMAATYLDGFRHVTGDRKRAVIATLLALCSASPFDSSLDPQRIDYTGQAAWTELTMCAIKILHCKAEVADHATTGIRTGGGSADQMFLVQRLKQFGPDRVWQGNALAHLIALHALHTFQPACPLLHDGIEVLVKARNPDGGVPFIAGQEVWVTALAGTALAGADAPSALLNRIGTYLAGRQLHDGGWGYNETTTQSDVDDTSRCVQFLYLTDPFRHHGALIAAVNYLTAIADPRSGGFPTYLKGHRSEVDLTAGALIALTSTGRRHGVLLNSAAKFLLDSQRADGSFEPSWTLSQTSVVSYVVAALDRVRPFAPALTGHISEATSRATAYLHETQNHDGGWGHTPEATSDALSTAHAIPALPHPHALNRAVDYLLGQQRPDGGFTAPADQVGPRPIPFDFPVLPHITALTALNHARNIKS